MAQMLYIWPFFAFFSAPLFLHQLLNLANAAYRTLTSQHVSRKEGEIKGQTQNTNLILQRSPLARLFNPILSNRFASVLIGCGALAVAFLIVRFNTIIHPFTLADNRHYMFYVFRYSILRAWWIRYALVPVYVTCAWLCWGALQGPDVSPSSKWIQSPFIYTAESSTPPSSGEEVSTSSSTGPASPPTSTVLMLLLATTLALMTAPLVEPRYFILPWVFWRLLVPASTFSPLSWPKNNPAPAVPARQNRNLGRASNEDVSNSVSSSNPDPSKQSSRSVGLKLSVAVLSLELCWFLLINAATMYIFVSRPFYWQAADGTLLDEGRLQRFMW